MHGYACLSRQGQRKSERQARPSAWKRKALARAGLMVALAFGCAAPATALDPAKQLDQFNVQTWSRQNGLPANGVKSIAQTDDGYLWLGTSAGLVRFDGVSFKQSELVGFPHVRDGNVNVVRARRGGGLWVGLAQGYGFYDGEDFTFFGKAAGGPTDMNVRGLHENEDGTLWVAGQDSIFHVAADGRATAIQEGNGNTAFNVFSVARDLQGRIWFSTANQGARRWQNGRAEPLDDPELALTAVYAVTSDGAGNLWLGTGRGLFRYDAALQRSGTFLTGEEVRTLFTDRHGVVWIGTTGSGLYRFHGELSESFARVEGLADVSVTAIAEDREGSMWIGTRTGLSHLTDVKFPTYSMRAKDGVKDVIAVAASPRGGVWLAHSGGATYLNGEAKLYSSEAGLPNPYVKRIYEAANGDVYLVSGASSLVVLADGHAVAVHNSDTMVVGIAEDEDGVVVSNGGALFRASRTQFAPYPFKGTPPELLWILGVTAARQGGVWVSTVNGIFHVKDGAFEHWSSAQGLTNPGVSGVCEDEDGILWAATPDGIARLENGRIRMIGREDGLLANNIYAIVDDLHGALWVDSDQGVFRVSRFSLNAFAKSESARVACVRFDGPEAVRSADKTVQERVGARSTDGRIWFPTSRGVLVVDPARIPVNRVAPGVHINRVRVNGVELPAAETIVVPPGAAKLEFEFAALSFIASRRLPIRYQLEGYDASPVERDGRRMATYTNLPPGRYRFRVTAANVDGVWNETGDELALELQPWFHQTPWFAALVGAAVCAAIAGVVVARTRSLRRRGRALQQARDRLEAEVQARTAELARSNASLQSEVEEHKRTSAELKGRTVALQNEIEERKRVEREVTRVHQELMIASREAGMAEVATSVLHNVGNVLNSVNVSATVVMDRMRMSRMRGLSRLSTLLDEQGDQLAEFVAHDPRGRTIPKYVAALAHSADEEREAVLEEIEHLRRHIEHIKEIVGMQQSYAKMSGVRESVGIVDLVEDALRMNAGALERHGLTVVREYEARPVVTTERHKVLQVLVNVIRNAKYACDESGRTDKVMRLRLFEADGFIHISVIDNGVGIPPENLTRIFAHGFTTRKEGHGFGLHSGSLAAKEIGGTLGVHSDGVGRGATFTLSLPLQREAAAVVVAEQPASRT